MLPLFQTYISVIQFLILILIYVYLSVVAHSDFAIRHFIFDHR
jgi:hypothetical protein